MQIAAARAHYNSGGARNSLPGAGLPTEQGAASREAGLDSLVEPETRPAPPRPAPPLAAAVPRLRGNSRTTARAIQGQGSPHDARNCPGNHCARTRKWGAREKDCANSLAAGGGVYPPTRPSHPAGWARAPPIALGRSVPSCTRLARAFARALPRLARTLALLPHLCAGAAGSGSIRAFPQPSGDPGGSGGGGG